MKRIALLFVLIGTTLGTFAQSADDLKEVLKITDSLTRDHPQEFLAEWAPVVERPEGASDSLWAQLHIDRGYAYFYLGELDSALKQFEWSVEFLGSPRERARMYNNIGAVLTRMERPREALISYQSSLEIQREFSDSIGTAKTLNNMGVLMRKIGDLAEARRVTFEAVNIYMALRDTILMGETYSNLGLIYKEAGHTDSARILFEESLRFKLITGNERSLASTYLNLGILNYDAKEYDLTEGQFTKAIELRKAVNDNYGLTSALGNLAELYMDIGRVNDAEVILYDLLEQTPALNYKPFEARTLLDLAKIQEDRGNFEKANEYFKLGHRIKDSIASHDRTAEIKEMQMQFERDQVILENECLRLEADLQKTALQNESKMQRIYIALIALLVFFGVVIGSLYRRQRRLNAELQLSDQRFRELANAPFIGIYLSRNGKIIESNSELDRMAGFGFGEVIPEHELLSYSFGTAGTRGLLNPVDGGKAIPVDVYHKSVELQDGPARIVALRDRREQERAEEAMLRATEEAMASERSKSEFLANMSHEIRTPMNGIIAAVDLLKKKNLKPEGEELIELIEASTNDLMQTLNDILDLRKVEAGKIDLEREIFDLKKAFSQSFTLFQFKAEQKGLGFGLIFEGDLPEFVRGDALRLKQILSNFLSNAIKFTDKGYVSIRVHGEPKKDQLWRIQCEVSDTGIGIEDSLIEQIFEKFSHADSSTTREFGGSGPGLAIAKSLSELMGGEVSVRSTKGEGSTFSFCIELEECSASGNPVVDPHKETADTYYSGRILVAEDNPVNQKIIEMAFKNLGVEFDMHNDGLSALTAYKEGGYDVVLMDIQMPVMDGLQAHDEIRAYERDNDKKKAYIVAMTANVMKDDQVKYHDRGLDDFLAKPFNLSQLKELLQRIDRHLQEREKH